MNPSILRRCSSRLLFAYAKTNLPAGSLPPLEGDLHPGVPLPSRESEVPQHQETFSSAVQPKKPVRGLSHHLQARLRRKLPNDRNLPPRGFPDSEATSSLLRCERLLLLRPSSHTCPSRIPNTRYRLLQKTPRREASFPGAQQENLFFEGSFHPKALFPEVDLRLRMRNVTSRSSLFSSRRRDPSARQSKKPCSGMAGMRGSCRCS